MNAWKPLPVLHALTRPDRVPAARYFDPDFFALECERLWPRVWQMACRLEEIPRRGDFVEYENLGQSVIVVRVDDACVKAYHNACRHRGMQLVKDRGRCPRGFVCPFHGWSWNLDGSPSQIFEPGLFDVANRDPEDLRLRECRVELWGGCAFVNFDDRAPSLRESIEPFASYHDAHQVERMRAEWWHSTLLPVNWKLAMEAFMEGYHTQQTHPQLLARASKRGYGPGTDTAGFTDPSDVDGSSLYFMKALSEGMGGMIHAKDVRVAEGLRNLALPADPNQAALEWHRRLNDAIVAWNRGARIPIPDLNPLAAQGHTSSVNFCFPNSFLLPVYGNAACYRIRPLGPEQTLFEIWSLTLFPEGEEPEPPRRPEPMPPDDPRWPLIPRQDFANLPRQQAGLHARGFEFMRLSGVVEGLIGNYHRLLDGYLAGLDYDALLPAARQVCGAIDQPLKDLGF